MVDLVGTTLEQQEKELLCHPLIGGVVLFSRNYESLPQLQQLLQDIHGLRTPRLVVAVDQEGGVVQRFRTGFTTLPANRILGKLYDQDRETAYRISGELGWLMAAELAAVGIDISFAPVVDLDWGQSSVIRDRAFHRDPYAVAELASRYIVGQHGAGLKSVIKHFPGHGFVRADSHIDLPVDERDYEILRGEDLIPFEHLAQGYGEGLMTAHVVFPKVDSELVTFSHVWLQHVLRDQLRFSGVVFSDDLNMQAAQVHPAAPERVRTAFQAGCDVVLLCNDRPAVMEVLDELSDYHNPVASLRLLRMRGKPKEHSLPQLRRTHRWKQAADLAVQHNEAHEEELEL